jgi:hypothetical protein
MLIYTRFSPSTFPKEYLVGASLSWKRREVREKHSNPSRSLLVLKSDICHRLFGQWPVIFVKQLCNYCAGLCASYVISNQEGYGMKDF